MKEFSDGRRGRKPVTQLIWLRLEVMFVQGIPSIRIYSEPPRFVPIRLMLVDPLLGPNWGEMLLMVEVFEWV